MTTYDAILPAGGRIAGDFAASAGTAVKALIDLNGRTILEHAVRSLRATGRARKIVVVGGPEVQSAVAGSEAEFLPEVGSGPDNILAGLRHLLGQADPPTKLLVMTTDLPFVEANHIAAFLDLCPSSAEICVPVIERSAYDARFPGSGSTWVKLADGHWTIGGMYLIDARALERAMPQIQRVFDNRKSVLGMAKLLGPAFLLRFLTKSLAIPDIETKVRGILGCTGVAVYGAPAELAFDIDAFGDLEYARGLRG